ncbi:chemotaxis-specific protein-glutamate methyltransferase CheB [Pseudobutyrivibrio ruminis]|uniref:Protein-glutamate methylesterase/protein-glutamine glutaminase n=1 Tax=Pseudobutyrivibrio ruminis DSM 9787 TaxID=1123011 RepID=A0A285SWM4_9FIRM|nr:chemotaxis-specific protein-glutamate methyltransferase CheB [Pseudobutyrivibrio ruminis]SOC12735.1 two-component system, chemotaxis family, response regulator CheB [Pseudobutyrivibrio ruminis DSM 9787]
MYKILVVDDSALMRRIICDIINADNDFRVIDVSADGEDAYNKIKNNSYDLVVLDMVLPKLPGVALLERLYNEKVACNAVLISSSLKEDADSTMKAMEYGALDFVVKPIRSSGETREIFGKQLVDSLHNVIKSRAFRPTASKTGFASATQAVGESRRNTVERLAGVRSRLAEAKGVGSAQTNPPEPKAQPIAKPLVSNDRPTVPKGTGVRTKKIIALACSTGGPQALHTFVPMLPANLSVPLVLVQHMPEGFTASLAARLDQISGIKVKEAEDGEFFKPGVVYITPGGKHMKICEDGSRAAYCQLDDSPPVNSLKPCADVMYQSLAKSSFDEIICVVLTGMGADGSEGIRYLNQYKKTYVISQEASTCVVYGMPKAVEQGGLSNEVVPLKSVANSIVKKLGGL